MRRYNKYYRVVLSMLRKIFQEIKMLRVNLEGGCTLKRLRLRKGDRDRHFRQKKDKYVFMES